MVERNNELGAGCSLNDPEGGQPSLSKQPSIVNEDELLGAEEELKKLEQELEESK